MTEDQEIGDPTIDSSSKIFTNKAKDKKIRALKPLTKIVLRRLPPTMTEGSFLEQVSPIPEHDYLCFAKPDPSIGHNLYSRAYINFVNIEDIYLFRDKFDGYVFLDEKGVEFIGLVEYAPFQRIPKKKKKKDPKCNTIESDPIYQEFVESLSKEPEPDNQPKLEYCYPISDGNDKKNKSTPLLEYLAARKQDKRGRDERRRRENDKRKMRIERKIKDGTIKKTEDMSEDETNTENSDSTDYKNKFWSGEQRVYHKSKMKPYKISKKEKDNNIKDKVNEDIDWDSHFPALSTKTHNTFTLSSGKYCSKKFWHEASQKSGGDSCSKEDEVGENEIKKIKPREWEKDKPKKDDAKFEKEDSGNIRVVYESKTFKEQRKANIADRKKKYDDGVEEIEVKKEPRDQKSKKYSDTRKERVKEKEASKAKTAFEKPKIPNHDNIKPFTQLPHVKTDDLSKMMDSMEKKLKQETAKEVVVKVRRNSMDSNSAESVREETPLARQKSLDERRRSPARSARSPAHSPGQSPGRSPGHSPDRSSEEREQRRAERRIRNKDRPSLVIYQPGMGRFSKQRMAKDKEPPSKVSDAEKKDT